MSSGSDSDSAGGSPPRKSKVIGSDSDSDSAPSHRSASPKKRADSDSDSDDVKRSTKQKALLDSDESDSEEKKDSDAEEPNKASGDGEEKKQAADLFGQDVSSSSEDEDGITMSRDKPKRRSDEERDSDADSRRSDDSIRGIRMHNPDDEDEEEKVDKDLVLNSEADLPRVKPDFGLGPFYAKMPNFLSVATHPFDEEKYEEDEDDEEMKLDEEGRNRLKLRVENTIRWRKYTDENTGDEVKESNAKFVKWSDGTMSLYLGNEIFEVTMMPLNASNPPHLFVRQQGGLAAQSVLEQKVTFRPHSTDSKTHRKVTMNMADRTRKSGQVKVMDEITHNPETASREAARREEEALRAHIRKSQQMRKAYRPRNLGPGFLERDSDDEEGRYRKKASKGEAPLIGASESEESDDQGGRKSRTEDNSDSDEEYRKRRQQAKKTIVTSDEDEDSD